MPEKALALIRAQNDEYDAAIEGKWQTILEKRKKIEEDNATIRKKEAAITKAELTIKKVEQEIEEVETRRKEEHERLLSALRNPARRHGRRGQSAYGDLREEQEPLENDGKSFHTSENNSKRQQQRHLSPRSEATSTESDSDNEGRSLQQNDTKTKGVGTWYKSGTESDSGSMSGDIVSESDSGSSQSDNVPEIMERNESEGSNTGSLYRIITGKQDPESDDEASDDQQSLHHNKTQPNSDSDNGSNYRSRGRVLKKRILT